MWSNRQLTLIDYWLLIRRHRWLFILPFITISIGTVVFTMTRPNIYRASTSVLVEAPKVPETYVQSTVATRVQERLRTVTQQITSRTRLEQVARELHLISDSLEGRALDDFLTKMTERIDVNVQGTGNDIFIVSYEGKDPRTVMFVANRLVSLFIDNNLKMREQYAEGTTEFLESELLRVGKLLQAQEKAVAEYKQRSMGELPSQQDANQRALDRLQMQLQSVVTSLNNVRTRKSVLLQQLAQQEAEAALSPTSAPSRLPSPTSSEPSALEQQLVQRRLTLATLQQVYTDTYPDVIHLKQEIAELEAYLAPRDTVAQTTVQTTAPVPPSPVSMPSKSISRQQQKEMEQIELEEGKLNQQQAAIHEQMAAYEKKITNATRREQELLVLTRDYETTRKNYDSLLTRRQQAQIAENLEKRQKSEQFRVLDEARIPTRPWKPKRKMMLLAGMAFGLAMGGGAVFVAAYFDHTFHDPDDLEQYTALPVLATVPFLMTTAEQRRQRLQRRCVWATCLLMPAVTIVAVHFLWMRLDVLFDRTLLLLNF
jgi:polysaccharide chain length determinant protein (PEP-CTERM system associated)